MYYNSSWQAICTPHLAQCRHSAITDPPGRGRYKTATVLLPRSPGIKDCRSGKWLHPDLCFRYQTPKYRPAGESPDYRRSQWESPDHPDSPHSSPHPAIGRLLRMSSGYGKSCPGRSPADACGLPLPGKSRPVCSWKWTGGCCLRKAQAQAFILIRAWLPLRKG